MKANAWAAMERGAALEPFEYELDEPSGSDCIVKVLSCGICLSDVHMIDNDWQMSGYPLVPGHEVVGEVVSVGPQVAHLGAGDRVGVGWQLSSCLQCPDCLAGNENVCDQRESLIVEGRGGFADYLKVDSRFAFPLPPGLDTGAAGPLLCGGITVFSGLHHAGMTSGQEIGVIGIGGLGHLAVRFASQLGNRVTVFTTSHDKAEEAARLGAHDAIVVPKGESPPAPKRQLNVLLNTVPVSLDWTAYLDHLAADGTLCFVAAPPEPLSIPVFPLLIKRKRIMGSPIGGRSIMTRMLSIAERFDIEPLVEHFPLVRVNDALERLRSGKARYRVVLDVS